MRKLNRIQKKMILDFSGTMSIGEQPRKVSDLNIILSAFIQTDPEKYKEAYDVIVLGIVGTKNGKDANINEFVATKVMELVKENVDFLKNKALEEIVDVVLKKNKSAEEKITLTARKEIQDAREEFKIIKIKNGNKKPIEMGESILPEEFSRLLQLAQERVNILMVGPPGCGKTFIASRIAEALELPFGSQSCSSGVSESVFTGWLLPTGSNAKFSHVMSDFLVKYEKGGVFLLDELDASDANVLVFINQALANESFMVPQRFEKPLIKKHKNFIAVAAANTFGHGATSMHAGRNALDAATLDRFKIGTIKMEYSPTVEGAIVDSEILMWGRAVRNIIETHSLQKIMSTRVMKDATKMKQGQEWSLPEIAKGYFSDWSPEEKRMIPNELASGEFL